MKNGWYYSTREDSRHLVVAIKDEKIVAFYNCNGSFDESTNRFLFPKSILEIPDSCADHLIGTMRGFFYNPKSSMDKGHVHLKPKDFDKFFCVFEITPEQMLETETLNPNSIFDIY